MHFFLIVSLVLFFMHIYLWLRLVRDPQFSPGVKKIGTWTVVLLFCSFPVSGFLARLLPYHLSFPLFWLVYLWLGSLTLFFFLFLFTDCLKIFYHTGRCLLPDKQRRPPDPERRRFLARAFAASASVLVFGTSAFGVKQCYAPARINRFRVRLKGLPDVFRGFRIVQISDIHIGEMLRAADLAEIVGQVNRLQPDLIAITGDMVDGKFALLRNEIIPLRDLRAKQGIFFVTGNHEYYSGVDQWLPEIEKMGITVLENTRVEIRKGGASFILAGVNDPAGRFGRRHAPPDYARALEGIDRGKKIILLAHQPVAVRKAAAYGVDLQLSGHTHGGQIWPFSYLVHLQQPFLKGFYRHGKTQVYVNQGTGCWGPPMRVGTYNEITEFVLR